MPEYIAANVKNQNLLDDLVREREKLNKQHRSSMGLSVFAHKDTPEMRNLKKKTDDLINTLRGSKKNALEDEDVKIAMMEAYNASLTYSDKKKDSPSSGMGQTRLEGAKGIQNIAQTFSPEDMQYENQLWKTKKKLTNDYVNRIKTAEPSLNNMYVPYENRKEGPVASNEKGTATAAAGPMSYLMAFSAIEGNLRANKPSNFFHCSPEQDFADKEHLNGSFYLDIIKICDKEALKLRGNEKFKNMINDMSLDQVSKIATEKLEPGKGMIMEYRKYKQPALDIGKVELNERAKSLDLGNNAENEIKRNDSIKSMN